MATSEPLDAARVTTLPVIGVPSTTRAATATPPVAMWGIVIASSAVCLYLSGVALALIQRLAGFDQDASRALVWTSGAPLLLGIAMVLVDVQWIAPQRRRGRALFDQPIPDPKVTVVLTAFNDETSIGPSVDDFAKHPLVARVLVIDNNSADRTAQVALSHGAVVHTETRPGYGWCVYRALDEARRYADTNVVALCEGDMTFRADDLDKLLPYLRHADVVNGTRIVEQLRCPATQLTSFMFYGNFIVAKLLEIKHLGRGTVSDVGTTYKICRPEFLHGVLPTLTPEVNLEFNAHFLDRVMGSDHRLVEAPVTFHPRVGTSKGGNTSNRRATLVGVRMLAGIALGWKRGSVQR